MNIKQKYFRPFTPWKKLYEDLPNRTSSYTLSVSQGFVDITSYDPRSQAIICVIGALYGFIQGLKLQNDLHWSKDLWEWQIKIIILEKGIYNKYKIKILYSTLTPTWKHFVIITESLRNKPYLLPGNGHVICDIRKHCWLNKVAFVPQTSSSTLQLGSFCFALLNVPKNALHLLLTHLGEMTWTKVIFDIYLTILMLAGKTLFSLFQNSIKLWVRLTCGPWRVSSLNGSPTGRFWASFTARFTNSS